MERLRYEAPNIFAGDGPKFITGTVVSFEYVNSSNIEEKVLGKMRSEIEKLKMDIKELQTKRKSMKISFFQSADTPAQQNVNELLRKKYIDSEIQSKIDDKEDIETKMHEIQKKIFESEIWEYALENKNTKRTIKKIEYVLTDCSTKCTYDLKIYFNIPRSTRQQRNIAGLRF